VPEVFKLAKAEVEEIYEEMHEMQYIMTDKVPMESNEYQRVLDAVEFLENAMKYLAEVKVRKHLGNYDLGYQEQIEKKMTLELRKDNAVRKLRAVSYALNMGSSASNGYRMSIEAAIGELEMIEFDN
jgi:hypothetical protein